MTRILLIDDQEVARIGIKTVLSESLSIGAWGEAFTNEDALRLSEQQEWDLAILDLCIDRNRGLDLLKGLRLNKPQIPVLIFTGQPEQQYAKRSIKAGASGYLSKVDPASELINAVKLILHGGRFLSPGLSQELDNESKRKTGPSLHDGLSDREYQVMRLLGSGKTVGEIANFLSISDKTVSTYRARILDKTSLRNNAEIVRYVVENGLLE